MRALLCRSICLLSLLFASSASAISMAWTPVGNPGNSSDPNNSNCGSGSDACGSVSYAYSIGTYEVTNAQYVDFLNAVAQSDPYHLYSTSMTDNGNGSFQQNGGILRSGADGSYTYATRPTTT